MNEQTVADVEQLGKVYGDGGAAVVALAGVSAGFRRGEFTAIMGPSGSGKSTFMHCLAGLDKPTTGKARIAGIDLGSLDDEKLTRVRREKIGFVFQSFNLLPTLSAWENIILPLSLSGRQPDRAWADRVITAMGLGDRLEHRPAQLSGGQQQRVACARALITRPELIVADEPTGNLDSRSGAQILGLLQRCAREWRQTVLMVTHDPTGPDQVALDRFTAERAGYQVGDQVRVIVNGAVRQVKVTGIFTADDARLAGGGTLVAFDLKTAGAQFAPAGGYTTADLVAAPGVSQDAIATSVRAALPRTFIAETGTSLNSAPADSKLIEILLLFAAVALFVAVFLVANMFTMLAAARARENALLRAVGASRRYVLRSVLAEAAVLGLIATVLGYLLGIGVAAVLNRGFSVINGPDVPLRVFSAGALAAALGVGVGVTMIAAYVPARRAAAIPPIAALRSGLPPTAKSLRRRNIIGVVTFLLGAMVTAAGIESQDLMYLGAPLLMLGLIVLTPWLGLGLTKLLRGPLTRLSGMRGTLAVENTRRNPRRTAATAATLMIGLSVCAAVTVMISSVAAKDAKETAAGDNADIHVTAIPFSDLSSGTTTDLAKVPGVQAVSPLTPVSVKLGERRFLQLTAVDPGSAKDFLPLTVQAGSLERLADGIAVSTATAAEYDLKVGSEVSGPLQSLGAADQPVSLPVVAVYNAPESVDQRALIPARLAPKTASPQTILVKAAPGQDPVALRERIQRTLANPVLTVQTRAEAADAASSQAEEFLNILYALLSVSVLIGALGVVNTMTMSTMERVREIGLLGAVGLGRKQVGSVLRWESVITAMLGAVIGLVAGCALGAMGVLSQKGVPLAVPWAQLGVFVLVTLVIGVLASLWPARTAARTPILTAIHSDTE